jgi:hypothetical protein
MADGCEDAHSIISERAGRPYSSNSDQPSTNPNATRGRGLRPFQQWWWAWRAFLQGVVTEMTDAHGRYWSRQQHGFRRLRQAIPAVKRARTMKGPRERSLESAWVRILAASRPTCADVGCSG